MLPATNGNGNGDSLQSINEQLYKQNLELAVRNKTLSLLRELYEISIQTLGSKALAGKLTQTIKTILEFDLVVICRYDATGDTLSYLNSAASDRLAKAIKENAYPIDSLVIPRASAHPFFRRVIVEKQMAHSETVGEVFPAVPDVATLQKIQDQAHLKTRVAFPLVIEGQVVGVMILGINRFFDALSQFEQESIFTIVNVVAVALDRARLYEKLEVTNSELSTANEKLKELDRQKTEFVSIASHQLRAPLTAIKGYSSMLLEGSFGEISEKVHGATDVIFQSSEKLVAVIEDFLNVTRIELGKMKYDITEFDFRALVEGVVKELRPGIEKKGLTFALQADNSQDYKVKADSGKLAQVINNLIDNAVKYTPASTAGGPTGSIALKLSRTEERVRLEIKDTGVGIDAETLPKLFEKFIRASDANETNTSGTGLGLYVAKQMITALGGKIWAESAGKGQGSTFIIEI